VSAAAAAAGGRGGGRTGSSPARVCIQRKGRNERSRRKGGIQEGARRLRCDGERDNGQQGTREEREAPGSAEGARRTDREMKRDGTINERKREGTCICMGKAGASRRGLEGERESDRDAAMPSRRGATRGREGSKRKGGNRRASERARERERERERGVEGEGEREGEADKEREGEREAPRAMGTGMALASLGGPLDGSVRNGPSTMPTHHGHTIMTVSVERGGRSWSP